MLLTSRLSPALVLPFASLSLLLAISSPALASMEALPGSYDLRNIDGHSYIGPIKDQGQLGSCYAFGANAAAESTYNRAMGLYDENAANFSESFIIWALSPYYEGFDPEGANNDYDELQALVDYGVCSGAAFPYTVEDPGEDTHMDDPRVQFTSWHRLPAYDIETMKRAISTFGAIDVGIYADSGFDGYTEGTYTNDDTATNSILDYNASLNHAVALVGWNDDADGLGTGAWILRNSWDPEWWGENGYMNAGYYSMKVLTSAAYLVYGDWIGEDFALNITENIAAESSETSGTTTAYGVYEWGGNNASVTNEARIRALITRPGTDALTHGIFLWAGDHAFIDNSGAVQSGILSDAGMATAYGLCLQGQRMTNSGSVTALALALTDSRASAYGARFFSFDSTGVFDNSGKITAIGVGHSEDTSVEDLTCDTYATGAQIDDAASVTNSGIIGAEANTSSTGLICVNVENTINTGEIVAYGIGGQSLGAYIKKGSFTNSGELMALSQSDDSASLDNPDAQVLMRSTGLQSKDVAILNSGTISSNCEAGTSIGVNMNGGSLINETDGEITAYSTSDEACGLDAYNASITNNGLISGNYSTISSSTLQGSGTFEGDLDTYDMVISPGNSIGTLTVDGDFTNTGTLTMNMEVGSDNYDQLVVSGFAQIDEEETNTLNIIPVGYAPVGNYTFISANGSSGSFATINTSAVFQGSSVSAGTDGFTLDLSRNSYGSFASLPELESMGIAMDSARPLASGELFEMLNLLDSFVNADAIQSAMSDLNPAMNATASFASIGNLHRTNSYISRHWKALKAGSAQDERPNRTWFSLQSTNQDIASFRNFPGFDEDMSGIVVGADHRIGQHWTAGVAVAHSKQTLEDKNSADNAHINTNRGYAYAMWDQKPGSDGLFFTSSIGAGNSRIKTKRSVNFLDEEIEGSHNAKNYTLSLGSGYDMNNKIWTTRPFFDIEYALQHERGYTERGTSGAALTFDSYDSESLQASAGFVITARFEYGTTLFLPELRILRAHEFMPGADGIDARFASGSTFSAPGRDLSQNHTTMGMALRTVIDDRVMATVDYEHIEYEQDEDVSDSVSAHVQIRF